MQEPRGGQLAQHSTSQEENLLRNLHLLPGQHLHNTSDVPLFLFVMLTPGILLFFFSLPPNDAAQSYFPLDSMETKGLLHHTAGYSGSEATHHQAAQGNTRVTPQMDHATSGW